MATLVLVTEGEVKILSGLGLEQAKALGRQHEEVTEDLRWNVVDHDNVSIE